MRYVLISLLLSFSVFAEESPVARVVVQLPDGTKMRGERIVPVDAENYILEVYRGFSHKIPRSAVRRIEELTEISGVPPRVFAREPKARLSDNEKTVLDRLIVSYFESIDQPAVNAKLMAELRKHDTLPPSDVATFTKRIWELALKGPKLVVGTSKFAHPRFPGNIHVEIHPNEQLAKGLPVFMALHGGGENSGDWSSGTGEFLTPVRDVWKKGILICPSVLQQRYAEWGRNPMEEEYVKEILKAAKRSWDIDTDRVYLGGHSMGGYGTWHIGGHQADVFAGLVSAAGGILTGQSLGEAWGWGVIGNLRHTPITFVHGTKDGPAPVWSDQAANRLLDDLEKRNLGNYVHRYVEITNGDHEAPMGKVGDAVKWALNYSRDPNPKTLSWEPSRSFVKHFHWLRVEKPAMFQRLEARIEGNTIEMTMTRIRTGFSLLLNDNLIDLTKPVSVRINGEDAFHGLVQPSVTAIIESIDDKLDKKQVYTARIDF